MKKTLFSFLVVLLITVLSGCSFSNEKYSTGGYSSGRSEQEVMNDYMDYVTSKKCRICGWAMSSSKSELCASCRSRYPEVAEKFDELYDSVKE